MPQPYDYTVAQPDVGTYFQAMKAGRDDRAVQQTEQRSTALAKYLPQALEGDTEARTQAMSVAGPEQMIQLKDTFMKMDARQLEDLQAKQGQAASLAMWADTPEKWAIASQQIKTLIPNAPDLPFEQRGAQIAKGQTVKDMMEQAYKEKMLANDTLQARANAAQSYAAADASRRSGQGGGSGLGNAAMQRAALAQQFGIDPNSDAGKKYILTGQLPASMSPTDKKAILEADQMVMASEQGLSMLNQAKALNPKAAGGLGMGTLAEIFAQIGDETALNTRDLENVLQSNVLPQLKAIFGGAPTEGERQILLDLQGSARKTVEERRRIIDRSIAAANARIGFYRDQAADIRGGSYYSPTRGQPQTAPTPPATGSTQPAANGGFTVRKVR